MKPFWRVECGSANCVCSLVGIPLYLIMEYGSILLAIAIGFVALIIFVLIVDAIATAAQLKGIQYALVVGKTNWMTTKTRPSGFSIGSRGSIRGYWRFREEVDHVEVKFEVHYEDGRVRIVTANEGTSKCDRLMSFVGAPPIRKENIPTQKAIEPAANETDTKRHRLRSGGEDGLSNPAGKNLRISLPESAGSSDSGTGRGRRKGTRSTDGKAAPGCEESVSMPLPQQLWRHPGRKAQRVPSGGHLGEGYCSGQLYGGAGQWKSGSDCPECSGGFQSHS